MRHAQPEVSYSNRELTLERDIDTLLDGERCIWRLRIGIIAESEPNTAKQNPKAPVLRAIEVCPIVERGFSLRQVYAA